MRLSNIIRFGDALNSKILSVEDDDDVSVIPLSFFVEMVSSRPLKEDVVSSPYRRDTDWRSMETMFSSTPEDIGSFDLSYRIRGNMLIAFYDEGVMVAFASLSKISDDYAINDVEVRKEFRGVGYGSNLYKTILKDIGASLVNYTTMTHSALRVWLSMMRDENINMVGIIRGDKGEKKFVKVRESDGRIVVDGGELDGKVPLGILARWRLDEARIDTKLRYHDELNPKLWNGKRLNQKVLNGLLKIAKDWASFSKIPDDAISDIVITGGNCNYNYSELSDIDVHLIVDTDMVLGSCGKDIVSDWLYDKKIIWTKYHPNIRIKGYPVELYAMDINEKIVKKSQGVYSLISDDWLSTPTKEDVKDLYDDPWLTRKIDHYIKMIDDLTDEDVSPTQEKADQIKELKNKFWKMRTAGIDRFGEYSRENLLYKSLRNLGKIDQLNDYLNRYEDEKYSID